MGIWVGIDVGKAEHHVVAIDDDGTILHSLQIANDQAEINAMISVIRRHRRTIRWAVDLTNGPAAMLIAVLLAKDADLRYVSGSLGARLAQAFHGEQKTDAKDALVIAQTLRMRDDLPRISTADHVRAELKLLTARRLDLVEERVRSIYRLQDLVAMICPALERALDLTNKGPVRLLTMWQTPAAIRRAGPATIETALRARRVTNADNVAEAAVTAARTQTIRIAGEATAAAVIAQLAADLDTINDRIAAVEKLLKAALARHELAPVITSLPGMGPVLSAEGRFRQWKHFPRRVRRISRRASSSYGSYGVGR